MWVLIVVVCCVVVIGIGGYVLGLKDGSTNYTADDVELNAVWLKRYKDLEQKALLLETQVAKERARADAKPDDTTEVALLKAQLWGQQALTDTLSQELYAAQAETKYLQAVIVDLRLEIASLQAVIEQDGRMPGYAAHIRKHERGDVARRLYAAGLSKRQIMLQVWSYIGSSSLAQLNRALESG